MTLQNLALLSRRGRIGIAMAVAVMIIAVVGAAALFLDPAPPRRIVLASGLEDGLLHEFAQRYIKILARAGITVEERITAGPGQNLQLLEDPRSGVDVAFVQGGIAKFPQANDVVMLASLYYVPMWVFCRDTLTLNHFGDLRGHRVSVGEEGSGARSFAEAVFKLNRLSSDNLELVSLSNSAAMIALKSGETDAAIIVDGAKSTSVLNALNEPNLQLFHFNRADAYGGRDCRYLFQAGA